MTSIDFSKLGEIEGSHDAAMVFEEFASAWSPAVRDRVRNPIDWASDAGEALHSIRRDQGLEISDSDREAFIASYCKAAASEIADLIDWSDQCV